MVFLFSANLVEKVNKNDADSNQKQPYSNLILLKLSNDEAPLYHAK